MTVRPLPFDGDIAFWSPMTGAMKGRFIPGVMPKPNSAKKLEAPKRPLDSLS